MSIFSPAIQRVYIGGVELPVRGGVVEEELGGAARISCAVEVDLDSRADAISVGASITVEQTTDAGTYVINGFIEAASFNRGENYTFVKVDAIGEAGQAKERRFLATYKERDIGELIREVWDEHGPPGVTTADVPDGPGIVEQYNSTFDSLADMMNDLANLTGWTWQIIDGRLKWFDPALNTGVELRQDAGHFAQNTIKAKRALSGVKNVARQEAWLYESITVGDRDSDCTISINIPRNKLPPKVEGWEVAEEPVFTVYDQGNEYTVAGSADLDERVLEPESAITPSTIVGGISITFDVVATFRIRKKVWVRREDSASIALYGRREAPPLDFDGGMSAVAAGNRLEAYLRSHAYPSVELSAGLTRDDVRVGQTVNVTIDDPAVSQPLLITSVKRAMSGPDLQVEIKAVDVGSTQSAGANQRQRRGARTLANPFTEAIRRVERLERRNLNPATLDGERAKAVGDLFQTDGFIGRIVINGGFNITANLDFGASMKLSGGWSYQETTVDTGGGGGGQTTTGALGALGDEIVISVSL